MLYVYMVRINILYIDVIYLYLVCKKCVCVSYLNVIFIYIYILICFTHLYISWIWYIDDVFFIIISMCVCTYYPRSSLPRVCQKVINHLLGCTFSAGSIVLSSAKVAQDPPTRLGLQETWFRTREWQPGGPWLLFQGDVEKWWVFKEQTWGKWF